MEMTTVYIPEKGHRLNRKMLGEAFELVDDPQAADVSIGWKTPTAGRRFDQSIVCAAEPPIVGNIISTYRNAARWHTFVTYDPSTPNAIPFSVDAPHMYPFWPWLEMREHRPDEELRRHGKGIYFAGHRSPRPDLDAFGAEIIYQRRAEWAAALARALGGVCLGNGWPQTSKNDPRGWGAAKFAEMREGDFDFIFAAENCRLSGYISEKFWHGLLSDRVMVYMGHRRIKEVCDPAAYVFADDFATPEELAAYLAAMTPRQYREIVHAARRVLDAVPKPQAAIDDLTQRIIERISR